MDRLKISDTDLDDLVEYGKSIQIIFESGIPFRETVKAIKTAQTEAQATSYLRAYQQAEFEKILTKKSPAETICQIRKMKKALKILGINFPAAKNKTKTILTRRLTC